MHLYFAVMSFQFAIVGEFGKYQKIRLCMICLVSVLCAFHAQNMVFVGARPAQYCTIPSVNRSGDSWKNVTQEDFNVSLRDVPENVGCSIRSLTETRRLVELGLYSFEELKKNEKHNNSDRALYGVDIF
ncbi:hypothetical protein KUTeg_007659 [Tegillarca granosa]|uniref:Uncharacterized protein n=1 Tax=Tegillarca granosa TaxID=220873 RepID=A0ABQ9FDY5_TEGGR|nr:hypothetical protein KUTeg_007659 [Tegillarca granosa]